MELYKQAIKKWGEDAQIQMCIEECAELIVKLSKRNRNSNGSTTDDIISELVDVEIMIEQLKIIYAKKDSKFNSFTFEVYKRKKIKRFAERLLKC